MAVAIVLIFEGVLIYGRNEGPRHKKSEGRIGLNGVNGEVGWTKLKWR